jgi:thiol-disulfide isomerase/thioredoxin
MRLAFVVGAAVLLVAFVLAQVVLSQDSPAERAKKLMPQIRAELVDQPLSKAQADWPLESGDERRLTLAQLPRDRLIFLNFWATWCAPCRDELPSMFRMRQELTDRPFMIVAVSYDEAWSDIRDFFQRWVGRLPSEQQMLLLKDTVLEEGRTLRETFGTTQIPDSYLILDGRVLARFVNARNWTDPSILEFFRKLTPEGP